VTSPTLGLYGYIETRGLSLCLGLPFAYSRPTLSLTVYKVTLGLSVYKPALGLALYQDILGVCLLKAWLYVGLV
jgi:hypothetical protein